MVTQDYTFALATILVNLRQQNSNVYDGIVVYHDGIDIETQDALVKIESRITFVLYTLEDWQQDHTLHIDSKSQQNFLDRFSHLALSKYKIFEQLSAYRQVLLLDLDMVIYGDLSPLFNYHGIAWRSEAPFIRKFGSRQNRPDYIGLDEVPQDHPAPNGGLIYLDDSMDGEVCLQEARHFINVFSSHFGSVLDELAFSWVAYHFNIPVTQLDHKIYNVLPRVVDKESVIVHFMGVEKPWNDELMQLSHPLWRQCYYQANIDGIFDSDKVVDFGAHGQILRKYANQNRWLAFLNSVSITYPTHLSVCLALDKERLDIVYDDSIFYSYTLNKNTQEYKLSLHIQNKLLLADEEVMATLHDVVAKNRQLALNVTAHQAILSTQSTYSINQISSAWQYFYQTTWYCLKLTP
ncbi:glycosyltransferase [Pelistega ratti]|nr:glycosyltransferase [Pelistega ratti]